MKQGEPDRDLSRLTSQRLDAGDLDEGIFLEVIDRLGHAPVKQAECCRLLNRILGWVC